MPIYEYLCPHGHRFEKISTIITDEKTKCPKCGSPAEQVVSVPAKRNPDLGIQR
jgi:putative FmdB family regulatory protein